MIVLKPYGGLGNRLRSIDSAVALSECTGRKLKVIWDANRELNAPFSYLLEKPGNFTVSEKSTIYLSRKLEEKAARVLHRLNINYPFGNDRVFHDRDILKLKSQNFDFCSLKEFNKIYLFVNGRFLTPEKPFQYLKPVAEIQDKVSELTRDFDKSAIGVHIRRTDNKRSIIGSPLKNFIELMEKEIQADKDTSFFLSTDSPEDQKYILEKFPGRVSFYIKELRRDRAEGVRDALIDLLCLSKTRQILGSYYSSFSEIAAEIGNIPLTIAGKIHA